MQRLCSAGAKDDGAYHADGRPKGPVTCEQRNLGAGSDKLPRQWALMLAACMMAASADEEESALTPTPLQDDRGLVANKRAFRGARGRRLEAQGTLLGGGKGAGAWTTFVRC
jgi:hypothetical protein